MDYWDYKEHDNGRFIEVPGKCEDYIDCFETISYIVIDKTYLGWEGDEGDLELRWMGHAVEGYRIVNLIIQSVYLVAHILFILALYRRRQPTPVWKWFFYLAVFLWIWVSGRFMETILYIFFPENNDAYVFAANYQYIGNTVAVVCYVIWIMYLSGMDRLASSRWFQVFLFLCPAVTCTLVFTNEMHHLFYTKLVMGQRVSHGAMFVPCLIWLYLILFSGYIISLRYAWKSGRDRWRQIIMFSLFPLLPAAGVLVRSISGVDRFDYTPLVMGAAFICLYQIFFRYHYVNIMTASVRQAIEQTVHPVGIVRPETGEIVYANRAAKEEYHDASAAFISQLGTTDDRLEGEFDGRHLIIDARQIPEEESVLIAVTDVSEIAKQQAEIERQIRELEEQQKALEETNRNIDAYIGSLYSTEGLEQKQKQVEKTYAVIAETFKAVEKNLKTAEEAPERAEPSLQENIRLTKECIAEIRRTVAQLKAG